MHIQRFQSAHKIFRIQYTGINGYKTGQNRRYNPETGRNRKEILAQYRYNYYSMVLCD